jgi:hypothetical protein
MDKKRSATQLKLYDAIDDILRRDWDPIGIGSFVEVRNEYETYLPQIVRLALSGDRVKIADYLFQIATYRMGLTTQPNEHLAIADKILAAKEVAGA